MTRTQGRGQSVQPNSQSRGWDVPAQPHSTCVIPKSAIWLSSRSLSPNQPWAALHVHVTSMWKLLCATLLPSLLQVCECLENPAALHLVAFTVTKCHLCPIPLVKCFITPPGQDPRPCWPGVRCSSQTAVMVSEISVSQRKMNTF